MGEDIPQRHRHEATSHAESEREDAVEWRRERAALGCRGFLHASPPAMSRFSLSETRANAKARVSTRINRLNERPPGAPTYTILPVRPGRGRKARARRCGPTCRGDRADNTAWPGAPRRGA